MGTLQEASLATIDKDWVCAIAFALSACFEASLAQWSCEIALVTVKQRDLLEKVDLLGSYDVYM